MARDKSTDKSTDKRLANLKEPWRKGESGNPKGKQPGVRDRRTVIWEALKIIAQKEGRTPEEIEAAIQVAGVTKAIKGSFLHYAEVSNGLYGKITDELDIKSGGKSLAELIAHANTNKRRKGNTKSSEPVS